MNVQEGNNIKNVLDVLWKIPQILEEKRVFLLLIDGLGINTPNFPKKLKCEKFRTVFPSSTPTFFYSFHSGREPKKHGYLEWYMRFKDEIITIPPWKRVSGEDLILDVDVKPKDIFPFKPFFKKIREKGKEVLHVTPYADTYFTLFSMQGCEIMEISSLSEIFPIPEDKDLIYVYWPNVDMILHQQYKGIAYEMEISFIETFVEFLLKKLPKNMELIITSDHGLVKTSKVFELPIVDDVLPVGGARVAFYRDVEKEKVEKMFKKKKIKAEIKSIFEIPDYGRNISKRCVENFGDVVAIAKGKASFNYPYRKLILEMLGLSEGETSHAALENEAEVGVHGGLSEEELYVNLWTTMEIEELLGD